MRSPIPAIVNAAPSASARNFVQMFGVGASTAAWGASDARRLPASFPFRLLNLYVVHDVAPGGAGSGKSFTYIVRLNGVDSPLRAVVSETGLFGVDSTHVLSVGDGDEIDLVVDPAGTPTLPTRVKWYVETEAALSFPVWGGGSTSPSTSAATYKGPQHGTGAWEAVSGSGAVDLLGQQVVPIAGRVRWLRARCNTAPGAAKSWTLTLYKNGSPTLLSAVVSGAGVTVGIDRAHQVVFAAGDTWSIEAVPSGGPASGGVQWCFEFIPATPGESLIAFGNSDASSTAAARFHAPGGSQGTAWNATESNRSVPIPGGYTVESIYALLSNAPGTAKSWSLAFRNAGAAAATVAVGDAAVANQTTGLSATPADRDLVSFSTTPSGTPAALTGGVHLGVAVKMTPSAGPVGVV